MDVALIARVLSMRGAVRARERWSAERIASHRAAQLDELRRYAYQKSPFYRRFHSGLETKPLHELPVLSKAELMKNFDEVVTDRAAARGIANDLRMHRANPLGSGRGLRLFGLESHAALRARARGVRPNLGVHGANIGNR